MIRLLGLQRGPNALVVTAAGHLLAVEHRRPAGPERAVWWDAGTGRVVRQARASLFGLSPDGRFVARWRPAGVVTVTDTHGPNRPAGEPVPVPAGGQPGFASLAVAPGGGEVAVSSGATRFYPLPTGPAVRWQGHAHRLSYSPGGRWVADAGWEVVRLWDRLDGHRMIRLPAVAVGAVAVGGDDRTAALVRTRRTVAVWDLGAGREVARLPHPEPVTAVAVAPAGDRVLTGDDAGTVRVWDARTGTEEAAYRFAAGRVLAVAVGPDGLTAAAAHRAAGWPVTRWDL